MLNWAYLGQIWLNMVNAANRVNLEKLGQTRKWGTTGANMVQLVKTGPKKANMGLTRLNGA